MSKLIYKDQLQFCEPLGYKIVLDCFENCRVLILYLHIEISTCVLKTFLVLCIFFYFCQHVKLNVEQFKLFSTTIVAKKIFN